MLSLAVLWQTQAQVLGIHPKSIFHAWKTIRTSLPDSRPTDQPEYYYHHVYISKASWAATRHKIEKARSHHTFISSAAANNSQETFSDLSFWIFTPRVSWKFYAPHLIILLNCPQNISEGTILFQTTSCCKVNQSCDQISSRKLEPEKSVLVDWLTLQQLLISNYSGTWDTQ